MEWANMTVLEIKDMKNTLRVIGWHIGLNLGPWFKKNTSYFSYNDAHGFTEWNIDGRVCEWRWNPLNDLSDALLIAKALKMTIQFNEHTVIVKSKDSEKVSINFNSTETDIMTDLYAWNGINRSSIQVRPVCFAIIRVAANHLKIKSK